jgi:hypothetical protein
MDDTRRPDSEPEFEEPIFSSDEELSGEKEPEPRADFASDSPISPEPEYSSGAGPFPPTGLEPDPGVDEPFFPADGETVDSPETGVQQVVGEAPFEPSESDYSFGEAVEAEAGPEEPALEDYFEQDLSPQSTPTTGTGWVNIAPDSEVTDEPLEEREYSYFEETPAADVVSQPPPTRKLGRTGPVWALGAIALVLIAGLVWLGITRLTGSPEVASETVSEPEVQQVAAETPTQQPPTAAPDPTAEPGPIQLPINTNVVVGDTEGEGVKLRASPGLAGTFIETIVEGSRLVVLEDEPGSEHEGYPVEKDGYLWYRMRVLGQADAAGNPLIGWSASDFFVVENQ